MSHYTYHPPQKNKIMLTIEFRMVIIIWAHMPFSRIKNMCIFLYLFLESTLIHVAHTTPYWLNGVPTREHKGEIENPLTYITQGTRKWTRTSHGQAYMRKKIKQPNQPQTLKAFHESTKHIRCRNNTYIKILLRSIHRQSHEIQSLKRFFKRF